MKLNGLLPVELLIDSGLIGLLPAEGPPLVLIILSKSTELRFVLYVLKEGIDCRDVFLVEPSSSSSSSSMSAPKG